jgi:hypothetical protein|nr:MAG TPA: hypothetical protein [Caudoviricetes sp.]
MFKEIRKDLILMIIAILYMKWNYIDIATTLMIISLIDIIDIIFLNNT